MNFGGLLVINKKKINNKFVINKRLFSKTNVCSIDWTEIYLSVATAVVNLAELACCCSKCSGSSNDSESTNNDNNNNNNDNNNNNNNNQSQPLPKPDMIIPNIPNNQDSSTGEHKLTESTSDNQGVESSAAVETENNRFNNQAASSSQHNNAEAGPSNTNTSARNPFESPFDSPSDNNNSLPSEGSDASDSEDKGYESRRGAISIPIPPRPLDPYAPSTSRQVQIQDLRDPSSVVENSLRDNILRSGNSALIDLLQSKEGQGAMETIAEEDEPSN
jgi:hypothetical protein